MLITAMVSDDDGHFLRGGEGRETGMEEKGRGRERESKLDSFNFPSRNQLNFVVFTAVVVQRDYTSLKRIVAALPMLAKAGEVATEDDSLAAEQNADALFAVIDRRDVPGRETPLHLAVRLHDATRAEILMAAVADWSLQNENGWSSLQEVVCN
ncbi:Hypothetical predicted protein [Olea europaea subsp. europaea]|uniref:Uncharacterized protein n=1 Tax=Olea europaea subsp. europaea TaxID=158383 RepID=A0A8S0VCF8_OLEEU|nr:Hypothetical predicted protein [Olea europaea subsp. europaea]